MYGSLGENNPSIHRDTRGAKVLRRRAEDLYNNCSTWRNRWYDIKTYISPFRGRFLRSSTEEYTGTPEDLEILNNVAMGCSRVLRAGLMSGLTSPGTPWFSLTLSDEDFVNNEDAAVWLDELRQLIQRVMAHSNFYQSMENMYAELADFGVAAMIIEEDEDEVIRCVPLSVGEFQIDVDGKGKPNVLYRRFFLTADQIVQRFGRDKLPADLENDYIDQRNTKHLVHHSIEPRSMRKLSHPLTDDMQYVSAYFLAKGYDDEQDFLSYGGYRTQPFIAPRWAVVSNEVYGVSPGMEALNDVRLLQKETEIFYDLFEKASRPPMNASPETQRTGADINAGAVNIAQNVEERMAPVFQPQLDMNGHLMVKENTEDAIKEAYYVPIFNSTMGVTKRQTAEEVIEKRSEKMVQIGPVLERFENEALNLLISRYVDILGDRDMIGEIPESFDEVHPNIQYNGLLVQAQKAADTQPLEQWLQFIAGLAEINPQIMDYVNMDEVAIGYARKTHVAPQFVRTDEAVAQMREQQAQAQQEQQGAEQEQMAAQTQNTQAQTAQLMSETNVGGGGGTALDRMLAPGGETVI